MMSRNRNFVLPARGKRRNRGPFPIISMSREVETTFGSTQFNWLVNNGFKGRGNDSGFWTFRVPVEVLEEMLQTVA
jgi:hypothetical protein